MERDEGRYAAVAQEMLDRGDPITPRFNGVVYLDKPPLLHWLTAASFACLGRTELAARLPTALGAVVCTLITYLFGARVLGPRTACLAAAILASSLLWWGMARYLRFDMLLSLAVAASLWWAWLAVEEPERGRGLFVLAAAAAAVGVLLKGPIALVLPGLTFLAYLACTRRLHVVLRVPWLACLGAMALIVVPWFWACERLNPGATRFFLLHENIQRLAGTTDPGHLQAWWFLIASLLAGVFPWTLASMGALGSAVTEARRGEPEARRAALFLLLWVGATIVVYSASRVKFPHYVLPALPPLALLIGRHAARPEGRWSLAVTGLFVAVVGVSLPFFAPNLLEKAHVPSEPFVGAIAVCGVGLGLAAAVAAVRRRPGVSVAAVAVWGLATWHGAYWALDHGNSALTSKPLAEAVAGLLRPGEEVIAYGYLPRGLVFYLDRRIPVVGGTPAEYDFVGNRGRLAAAVIPLAQAHATFGHAPGRLGVSRDHDWAAVQAAARGHLRLLQRCGRYVIFRTEPAPPDDVTHPRPQPTG